MMIKKYRVLSLCIILTVCVICFVVGIFNTWTYQIQLTLKQESFLTADKLIEMSNLDENCYYSLDDMIYGDWDVLEVFVSPVLIREKDADMVKVLDQYAPFDWTDISSLSVLIFYYNDDVVEVFQYNTDRIEFPTFHNQIPDNINTSAGNHFYIENGYDEFRLYEHAGKRYCCFIE